MIERCLQNLTIRKYGTAFLEAFGMLPLTYFGAIGDNMTDNYANIQVAIDESIKRGLQYIFVPNGTYYYSGNLLHAEQVIFIGNEKYAKIYNKDGEIKIYQIGAYVDKRYLRETLIYEKGDVVLNTDVVENGELTIMTNVEYATEALIVIGETVFKIEGEIVTRNGQLFSGVPMFSPPPGQENYFYLGQNIILTGIKIVKNAIQLSYVVQNGGGTINKNVYWRVR